MKQHKKIWIVASLVGALILAGCDNNQPNATSTASAPAVQETTPPEAAPTARVETTATTDAAAGSQATAEPTASTEATPMATAAAGAQMGISPTVLSGSDIAFEGVNIAVDNAMIPSVSAYSGPLYQNTANMDFPGMMSGASNLTGTVLTLSGFKGDPAVSTFFEQNAKNTLDFIDRILEEFPPIQRIQTDRGSEFFAAEVQQYSKVFGIKFRPNKPRTPYLNGKVE